MAWVDGEPKLEKLGCPELLTASQDRADAECSAWGMGVAWINTQRLGR